MSQPAAVPEQVPSAMMTDSSSFTPLDAAATSGTSFSLLNLIFLYIGGLG
ncbi:MAG: hypothetical protein ACOX5R_22885 [bacterium]